ncbi:hypothetical protein [Actinomadura flavalba]|uniref:hypothetical protein n=1 Tax=Actinomadura flavalba TaxID=1120938 RepID=UPI00037A6B9B|nr:hypothetical protein [Actinomadura flavalba]
MSALTALARLEAVAARRARPLATVRHCHLSATPLVVIPLRLAGEAGAPLAVMLGGARDEPVLLAVPQPRNRDLRFAFAAELGKVLLEYVEASRGVAEDLGPSKDGEDRVRYTGAPQLVLPNTGGVAFLRLLGRSTRFRRTEGEHAVEPAVPALGRWLTWFAERRDRPGSSLTLALTEALRLHWATGQSSVEDANLAALLGWIDPPDGLDGPAAATIAEDPARTPPAGPATDPKFDNDVLAPAIAAFDEGADGAGERVREALRTQLAPTWELCWRALDLLAALPEGASVAGRWERDRDAFTHFHQTFAEGVPQARRDSAVGAARRLHRLERAQESYEAQRAFDDPLVMAEYRLEGLAFGGTVTEADPERLDESGKRPKLRPRLRVATEDPLRLEPGATVCDAARPKVKGKIVEYGAGEVLVELTGGLGKKLTPEPGTVPEAGARVVFTSVTEGSFGPARFPEHEETPWTHGGPPAEYVPDARDAGEAWS